MRNKVVPTPFKHQMEALQFVAEKDYFALFMEPGTGKTKVIIEKSFYLWEKGLIDCLVVVAPNAIKPQWIDEQFPEHFPSDQWNGHLWDGDGTMTKKNHFHDTVNDKEKFFVLSVNVEALQSDSIDLYVSRTLTMRKCFVVIDESTSIKNGRRKPKRGKRGGAKRTNKLLDYSLNIRYKAIMTGTPTPKGPFDLWAQFEYLKRDFFGMDYFLFTHHYGIMIQKTSQEGKRYQTTLDEKTYNLIKYEFKKTTEITPRFIEDLAIKFNMNTRDVLVVNRLDKYSAYKNIDELMAKISTITFFAQKKDCLDLPPKIHEKLTCEMGKVQKAIYLQAKKEMYAAYSGEELTVTTKCVLALRLQMVTGGLFPYSNLNMIVDEDGLEQFELVHNYKRIEENGKLKVLLEDIERTPDDISIIIWARFRGEIELITEALKEAGYSAEKYYGGSSYDVINRFKAGETRILVANPAKGGAGLNLQISTLQYFYSNSFKIDDRIQSEDRSHRSGQTNKVTYKDLICPDTVDVRIWESLKRKEDLMNYFQSGGMV